MKRFLHEARERAREENRLFDWVYTGTCWKPVKSYRVINRGKFRGSILVTLFYPPGKKIKDRKEHMRYKERTDQ